MNSRSRFPCLFRSVFSAVPAGHFGVGEAIYSRFTAPMREIVGIFCHKEALDRYRKERKRLKKLKKQSRR